MLFRSESQPKRSSLSSRIYSKEGTYWYWQSPCFTVLHLVTWHGMPTQHKLCSLCLNEIMNNDSFVQKLPMPGRALQVRYRNINPWWPDVDLSLRMDVKRASVTRRYRRASWRSSLTPRGRRWRSSGLESYVIFKRGKNSFLQFLLHDAKYLLFILITGLVM